MFEIVSFGELLIDFTPVGLSENGNPIFERNPGGGPANMACAAAKLGAKTAFMGKVGDDIFGRALQKVLEGQNVDARGLLLSNDDKTRYENSKFYCSKLVYIKRYSCISDYYNGCPS